MPKTDHQEIKLIMSVARDLGIRLSNRMATKASVALSRIEDKALEIPDIEAYLRLWSDPTGERAVRNVMAAAA